MHESRRGPLVTQRPIAAPDRAVGSGFGGRITSNRALCPVLCWAPHSLPALCARRSASMVGTWRRISSCVSLNLRSTLPTFCTRFPCAARPLTRSLRSTASCCPRETVPDTARLRMNATGASVLAQDRTSVVHWLRRRTAAAVARNRQFPCRPCATPRETDRHCRAERVFERCLRGRTCRLAEPPIRLLLRSQT